MDLATLRDTDLTHLYAAADAYDTAHRAVGRLQERWRDGVDGRIAGSGWSGPSADLARPALHRSTGELKAARSELRQIGRSIRVGADALVLAQSALRKALADVRTEGMSVDERGSVSWPAGSHADRDDPEYERSCERTARQLAGRIATALTEAEAVDQALSARLRHYTGRARDGSGLDPVTATTDRLDPGLLPENLLLGGVPGEDAAPAEVNAWWTALPADRQQWLIEEHPDLVGNRDGIPALARDRANRILLPRLIAAYEKGGPDPYGDLKLAGFRSIARRLRDTDGTEPPVLLLGIGAKGQGRGILSFGDPDTADDVTSLVGGLDTRLQRIGGGDADRAKAVYDAARRADPTRSTASIAWLGYDAPLAFVEAGDPSRARGGVDAYRRFLEGQRVTHQGTPAHVTAQGHSFGSLLVGLAAQKPAGIAADDVILVGSPGTGASHASEFSVGADHTYVGAASWDHISHLGWYTADPAGADFGARRFAVDGGSPDFTAHSAYWDDGPHDDHTSVDNIGRIVSGQGSRITGAAGRRD
ncbi:alpha/beta hydrolase family protein [Streptomyces sp. 1114.5]|uniref:alpha/beta hydrolase n=1 Tax=Streptomyces sp. 1114.5 TaxID=1938830 RepID=UPI000EAF3489|nr:alpha/beta hydrolase [Streptomyces sp. 1114.5]RKT16145.1 alpha/beta hydrolase family protein [Streptomyces sp. 1114.5]